MFSLAAVLVALASNLENLAVGFSLGIGARRIGLLPNAIAIGAWTLVDPLLPAARTAGPWRLSKIYEAGDASPPALLRATVDVSGEAFVDLAAEVRMAIARD